MIWEAFQVGLSNALVAGGQALGNLFHNLVLQQQNFASFFQAFVTQASVIWLDFVALILGVAP